MASENTPMHPANQFATAHDAAPGSRGDTVDTSRSNSGRQSSRGAHFSPNQRTRTPPPTPPEGGGGANIAHPAQPERVYISQSPTALEPVDRRGDPSGTWQLENVSQNRIEYSPQQQPRHSPPLMPGMRLVDNGPYPARPANFRTVSIDPNVRLSGGPPQSGRMSYRPPSQYTVQDDTGEKYYTKKALPVIKGSIQERLKTTIDSAEKEKTKYATRASTTGLALNIAIGLQVLLGSLTTGLSAVATSGGRSTAIATTILGALATLVASYLARARGSNEPELSITRTKDLEHFLRECKNFSDDHSDYTGHELDAELDNLRNRFEELLGNGNGERKLSPPGA